jgi:hypothetical protein
MHEISVKQIEVDNTKEKEFERKYIPFLDKEFKWTQVNPFKFERTTMDGLKIVLNHVHYQADG